MSVAADRTPITRSPLDELPIFLGVMAVSAPFLALASWGDATEGNPLRRFFVTLALAAVAGVVTFFWSLPRAVTSRRPPAILAALAVLSLPAYWMGVTPVLGLGAVLAARRRPRRDGLATVALVLGGLATLAFAAAVALGL